MIKFNDVYSCQNQIVQLIKQGAVLIFPTETIYGIGCSALQDKAIRAVYEIKGRAPDQPPPILIGNDTQLNGLISEIPLYSKALMREYWPGSLTLILPARDEISSLLCGLSQDGKTRTVGVRWTGHPVARVLCEAGAPLVATSANFSGATGRASMPQVLDDIPEEFQNKVQVVIDGGVVRGTPSTIIDCSGDAPRVVRKGAVNVAF